MFYFAALTVLAVGALLASEYHRLRLGIWIAKPLAASGFVAAALAAGALHSTYGRWILAALVLSWVGDVLLIPRASPQIFRAGILSFLLGHAAFVGAFAVRGLDPLTCALAALITAGLTALALRWLRPHVPVEMRIPVYAYMAVISAMLVCAAGTSGAGWILLGALMFYISDLAVARDRFVAASFSNRAWGLPLYFGAQLVLASTVA